MVQATVCCCRRVNLQSVRPLDCLMMPKPSAAGRIVYHGPQEHVIEFFAQHGFVCPERKGVADFLQEVTSHKDQKVRN